MSSPLSVEQILSQSSISQNVSHYRLANINECIYGRSVTIVEDGCVVTNSAISRSLIASLATNILLLI